VLLPAPFLKRKKGQPGRESSGRKSEKRQVSAVYLADAGGEGEKERGRRGSCFGRGGVVKFFSGEGCRAFYEKGGRRRGEGKTDCHPKKKPPKNVLLFRRGGKGNIASRQAGKQGGREEKMEGVRKLAEQQRKESISSIPEREKKVYGYRYVKEKRIIQRNLPGQGEKKGRKKREGA